MQEKMTIARPYAHAIFAIAGETKKIDQWSQILQVINTVVLDSQFQSLLKNPKLSAATLAEFVIEVCAKHLNKAGHQLVVVLAGAGRLLLVPEISTLYEQLRTEAEGSVEVDVISAYKLEAKQRDLIAQLMTNRLSKKIGISDHIDKSLIGGVVIRIGDTVIDASLKGRLKALTKQVAV